MDRRQKKTRQAIFAAFRALLASKSYSGITVQEIIDEANVGRSTFYAHFETKDELLRAMCTDIFEHVFAEQPGQEQGHDFSCGGCGIETKLTHMLYHLQENGDNLRSLLHCESGELFMKYFKQYLAEMFSRYVRKDCATKIPADYLVNHMVCDFAETVRWWMTGHSNYTPEQMTGFFLDTVPEGILQRRAMIFERQAADGSGSRRSRKKI